MARKANAAGLRNGSLDRERFPSAISGRRRTYRRPPSRRTMNRSLRRRRPGGERDNRRCRDERHREPLLSRRAFQSPRRHRSGAMKRKERHRRSMSADRCFAGMRRRRRVHAPAPTSRPGSSRIVREEGSAGAHKSRRRPAPRYSWESFAARRKIGRCRRRLRPVPK